MNGQTENVGICLVLFIVFPEIMCTFGSFTSINIYCCPYVHVCSVCLVGLVHVLIIWNILFHKSCR